MSLLVVAGVIFAAAFAGTVLAGHYTERRTRQIVVHEDKLVEAKLAALLKLVEELARDSRG